MVQSAAPRSITGLETGSLFWPSQPVSEMYELTIISRFTDTDGT